MESIEKIGLYSIKVNEFFVDNEYLDEPLEFAETITVKVLDPCIHSEIDYPSTFSAFYDEEEREILVTWSEFRATHRTEGDAEFCAPVPLTFGVSCDVEEPSYSADLDSR